MTKIDDLAAAAAAMGLRLRGGFSATPADGVPALADGRTAVTLVLLGAVGGSAWPAFVASPEAADGDADPLDRWSRRVVSELAEGFGAGPLFPFGGPPYLPFQRWARRAEPVSPSPLGLLIHPRHGLWHAYRGALAFAEALDLPAPEAGQSPCLACTERPCLAACPVGAFAPPQGGQVRYDLAGCVGHLRGAASAVCRTGGCLARRACPVAADLAYAGPQAAFHMRAFLAAHRGGGIER